MSNDHPPKKLSRRNLLKGAAAGTIAAGLGAPPASAARAPLNRIREENAKPGTTDWQLTYTRVDPKTQWRSPLIEGFVSRASVSAGETMDIMVSTNPAGPFTLDIYRMGYYGGDGGRHMMQLGPFEGTVQPDPPVGAERVRECVWSTCATLTIPEDWLSGVYLGKLSLVEDRYQSYIVFIVRDARQADLLFQCSDNTWQAYNRWPDNFALYDDGQSSWALKPGIRVSYDRPYGKYCQILDAPLSQGSGEFLLWEFPLAYWLEEQGYDVTYCSNTDVHASAETLLRAKTFLSVGHDEYWSLDQFNHVKHAIDEGVNAAFFSGNTCCFVAPMEAASNGTPHRTLTRAGRYGGLLPEEEDKMGPFPMEGPKENMLIGARTISPFNGSGDWIIADPDSWIFEGTGVKKGDAIPGLVGWEFHGDPAPIPGLVVVAEGEATNAGDEIAHWTATLYPGPKGNWVFNASTIWWAQGLSTPPGHMLPYSHFGRPHGPDERVQKITSNLLKRGRMQLG
ncbi:MAG: twin-arginine translocation signal domain-containing protein [Candidatus Hydrogenedentes bacterium]|nr:twin-arginine translocation signal domain-containing protein [Candidatus Hydrogenedentota bacterium]